MCLLLGLVVATHSSAGVVFGRGRGSLNELRNLSHHICLARVQLPRGGTLCVVLRHEPLVHIRVHDWHGGVLRHLRWPLQLRAQVHALVATFSEVRANSLVSDQVLLADV